MYTDKVYIKKPEEIELREEEHNAALPGGEKTLEADIEHEDEDLTKYSFMLLAGIIYPLVYESV